MPVYWAGTDRHYWEPPTAVLILEPALILVLTLELILVLILVLTIVLETK